MTSSVRYGCQKDILETSCIVSLYVMNVLETLQKHLVFIEKHKQKKKNENKTDTHLHRSFKNKYFLLKIILNTAKTFS